MTKTSELSINQLIGDFFSNLFSFIVILIKGIFSFIYYRLEGLYLYISFQRRTPKEKEIFKLLLEKTILPVSLIIKGDKIEANKNYFKNITNFRVELIKENEHTEKEKIITGNMGFISKIDSNNNLIFYVNKASYKNSVNNINEESNQIKFFTIKHKLFSLNLSENYLSLNDNFIKKFEDIINCSVNDEERAKRLENIFEENGYYIPLKIYFGGTAIMEEEIKISNTTNNLRNDIDVDIKSDNQGKLSNSFEGNLIGNIANKAENHLYKLKNYKIKNFIGGDKSYFSKEKLEDWGKNLSEKNCEVIEYTNLISIRSIIPSKISNELQKSLDIVEENFVRRKKFYKTIKSEKKNVELNNTFPLKKKGNISLGICDEDEKFPKIKKTVFYVQKDYLLYNPISKRHSDFTEAAPNKSYIVGCQFIWKDQNNTGEILIEKNPIGQRLIKGTIESKTWYSIDITLNLYCIYELD